MTDYEKKRKRKERMEKAKEIALGAASVAGSIALGVAKNIIVGQATNRGNAAVDKWLSKDKSTPEAPKSGIFKNKAGRK